MHNLTVSDETYGLHPVDARARCRGRMVMDLIMVVANRPSAKAAPVKLRARLHGILDEYSNARKAKRRVELERWRTRIKLGMTMETDFAMFPGTPSFVTIPAGTWIFEERKE